MSGNFSHLIVRVAPIVFVFLWATGFVGAKYGTADAEPFTFLAIRFSITFSILLVFVLFFLRPTNIDKRQLFHSILIGCLIHGVYLGGIFFAIDRGMAAGISSLIVALQPFVTAITAWFVLSERLSPKKALFFFGALAGVGIVLFPDFEFAKALPGINSQTLFATLLGTVAIGVGAVYQKRAVTSLNLWVSTTAQFAGASVLLVILAVFFETGEIKWSPQVIFALSWLIFVLSIGAIALLMFLIRDGNTSSVASLFFLCQL